MYVGKCIGPEILFSNFVCDNLNCYISFKKTWNKFTHGFLSQIKCAFSKWLRLILSKSPEKTFVFLEQPITAVSVQQAAAGKSQWKVSRRPCNCPLPISFPRRHLGGQPVSHWWHAQYSWAEPCSMVRSLPAISVGCPVPAQDPWHRPWVLTTKLYKRERCSFEY